MSEVTVYVVTWRRESAVISSWPTDRKLTFHDEHEARHFADMLQREAERELVAAAKEDERLSGLPIMHDHAHFADIKVTKITTTTEALHYMPDINGPQR